MAKLSLRTEPTAPVPATFAAKAPPKPGSAFAGGAAKKKKMPYTFGSPVTPKGRMVFTRQLATLVKAGMPIMRRAGQWEM